MAMYFGCSHIPKIGISIPMIGNKHMKTQRIIYFLVLLTILGLFISCRGKIAPSSAESRFQLTYVSSCQQKYDCMYAVEVGCLKSEQPCFGKPQLIFSITKQSSGPRPPFISYSWSPNGNQIAIEAVGVKGKDDIFVRDWEGKSWTNITNTPNNEGEPAWSPDSNYLAYTANSGEPEYITKVIRFTLEGGNSQLLLNTLKLSDFPSVHQISWSSNEQQLVFIHSDENGYNQLFITDLDGTNLVKLTNRNTNHFYPSYSPDGQWIVYIRDIKEASKVSNIYLIHPDGTGETAVTQDEKGWKSTPAWSSTGNWIAFTTDIGGNYDIYLIRPDGTGLTKVTNSGVDEITPSWRKISQ